MMSYLFHLSFSCVFLSSLSFFSSSRASAKRATTSEKTESARSKKQAPKIVHRNMYIFERDKEKGETLSR